MNKWKIAFFFLFGLWVYSLCALIESRHLRRKTEFLLTATVDECADRWLSEPLREIKNYRLEK